MDMCEGLQYGVVVLENPTHFGALVTERDAVRYCALDQKPVQPQAPVLGQDAERENAHALAPFDFESPQDLDQPEREQSTTGELEALVGIGHGNQNRGGFSVDFADQSE